MADATGCNNESQAGWRVHGTNKFVLERVNGRCRRKETEKIIMIDLDILFFDFFFRTFRRSWSGHVTQMSKQVTPFFWPKLNDSEVFTFKT